MAPNLRRHLLHVGLPACRRKGLSRRRLLLEGAVRPVGRVTPLKEADEGAVEAAYELRDEGPRNWVRCEDKNLFIGLRPPCKLCAC